MPTLYRKYRPAVFADVVGQETVTQTIQNEIISDRLSHAYLFSGPRGVGKTTLARLLARSVSCEKRKKGDFEPCNECGTCKQINDGRHIDIIEIDAASQTGVDNVRENIIENAGVMPTVLKYKIFIIDEVHMLSISAFNALLKTLEEPPAHVIFILATTELHKLPATVISRCERYSFRKISYDIMLARLKKLCAEEKVKVDKEVLERIVRKSDGGLRDAESLLGQILSLGLKEVRAEDIQMVLPFSLVENLTGYLGHIVEGEPGKAILLVNKLTEEGVELNQFAHDLLEMLRGALLITLNSDKKLINADFNEETIKNLRKTGSKLGEKKIVAMLDLTLKRKAEIKFSPLPQLPLEMLAIEMSELATSAVLPEITKTFASPEPAKETAPPKIPDTDKSALHQITDSIKNAFSHITEQPLTTTIAMIEEKWKEIVEKASATVPSLNYILASCTLNELNGNTLKISVPFSIHKDKLETAKNRQLLEDCLQNIFSEKIRLSFYVAETAPDNKNDLSELASEFGGEIVG